MTLNDQISQALDRALVAMRAHLEADLQAFAHELAQAAETERVRAVQEAAESAAGDVRRQAEAQLVQLRDAAQRQADTLRRTAEVQIAELQRNVEGARRDAQRQIEEAQRAAAAQIQEASAAAEAQAQQLRRALDEQASRAESEWQARLERSVAAARSQDEAHSARLVAAIRAIDAASTVTGTLDALGHHVQHEAERTAILVVRDGALRGFRFFGFDQDAPSAESVSASLDEGLVSRAVRTGEPVSSVGTDHGNAEDVPPFARGRGPRRALALPLRVGGPVVAVIYADAPLDAAGAEARRWPAILEVLVRHASQSLHAMTIARATGLSGHSAVAHPSHGATPGSMQ